MPEPKSSTLSLERYAPDARAWVAAAQALADERGHAEITPLHLLARGLERLVGVTEALRRAGADPAAMGAAVERALGGMPRAAGPSYLSSRLLDLLARAERDADRERAAQVGVPHVLAALAQEIRGPAGEILSAFGIGPGALKPHLGTVSAAHPPATAAPEVKPTELRDLTRMAREGAFDPVIGRDAEVRRLVTILERRGKHHPLLVGEPGVGKGAVVHALARRIASGDVPTRLAQARLLEVDVGVLAAGARLRSEMEARVQRLLSALQGAPGEPILVVRGIEQLFGQGGAAASAGDALRPALASGVVRLLGTTSPEGLRRLVERDPVFARELTVLPVEEPAPPFAAEILRGITHRLEAHHDVHVAEGAIVSAVTFAKRYLADRFLPDAAIDLLDESAAALRVETDGVPAETDRALRRLESVKAQLASLEGVDDAATRAARERLSAEAAELAPRVAELRKSVDARRGAVAAARAIAGEIEAARTALEAARGKGDAARVGELAHVTIPALEQRHAAAEGAARSAGATLTRAVLTEAHVASTVAQWTGIPVAKMLEEEAEKLLRMEARLEQRVVGQSEGVRALSRAVRRGRVGLRDQRRPIGSFLFLGPSGVGKTELAKALAEFLFDDESALTRLDMSEFMERHMAQRLLGAPPGYADSEQGGFLTEAVRRRPFSVLLFDEVEKGHQDVFNLLLQVLDDGRLTDGRGRLADFSNTVVIMTSNIGSERILEASPALFDSTEGREALRGVLLDQLGKFFRPEFLNRIDDVIVFRPLSRDDLSRIADIQLGRVRKLLEPKHIGLEVTDDAKARLVELGYEPALGARPLRRAILQHVQDPLAEKLLEKGSAEGTTLRVRLDGERLVLEPAS